MEVSEWIRRAAASAVSSGEVRGRRLPPQKRCRWGWGNSSEERGSVERLSKALGGILFRQIPGDLRDALHLHFEMWPGWFAGK